MFEWLAGVGMVVFHTAAFFFVIMSGIWCLAGGDRRFTDGPFGWIAWFKRSGETGTGGGGQVASGVWGLLAHVMKGRIVRARARRLAKGGSKHKH